MGCHLLLQCMKVKSEREVAQSCLTLNDPMDCSLPGSSAHGIFQARVLEWGAIAFSIPSLSHHQHQTLSKGLVGSLEFPDDFTVEMEEKIYTGSTTASCLQSSFYIRQLQRGGVGPQFLPQCSTHICWFYSSFQSLLNPASCLEQSHLTQSQLLPQTDMITSTLEQSTALCLSALAFLRRQWSAAAGNLLASHKL